MPGSCFWGIWFCWVLVFIEYRAYSINSPHDVIGHCTMNVEDWGQGEFPSNSGNSLLLSLDWDMTEEGNVHVHNNQSQTNHWVAQTPGRDETSDQSLKWERSCGSVSTSTGLNLSSSGF